MILKKDFIEIIDCMRDQYNFDLAYTYGMSELLDAENVSPYDNSKLIKSLINVLRLYFSVDLNGFCEIEHYCYVINFGKLGDEYESPEELYDRLLNSRLLVSGLVGIC